MSRPGRVFLYLAVVLDAFSRRIVGWSMANTLATRLVLDALNMALMTRRPRGVIHHSDQGSQPGLKWSSQHGLCWPIGRHRSATPRCLTVTLEEFISIAGYHPKHVTWRRCFRRCWWPNLDKHSAVLGLVQDEPALRAGAASGILDKTCARRSAGGRSAPRNGPLSLTKECNLDLGSGEAASEAMETPNTVSSERRLTWPILAIGQAPLPAFAKQASFGALC